jgi:hypothetical protein
MRGLLAMVISAMSFMVAANDDWVDGWVCWSGSGREKVFFSLEKNE